MKDESKTRFQLINELQEMRRYISELENQSIQKKEVGKPLLTSEFGKPEQVGKTRDEAFKIINSSPLVVFVWRNEEGWPVEFVTDNMENVFGYKPDELLSGKVRYDQIVHPDDLARVAAEVAAFSAEKSREEFVHESYRVLTKEGKVRWIEDRTNIRRDESGDITHYQGIVLDITDRKRAEKSLWENEEKFRLYVENAHDGVMIVGADQRFEYVNSELGNILGYPMDEIIGQPFSYFLDEKSKKLVVDHYIRRQKGEAVPSRYGFNIIRKNGEKRNVEISAAVTTDAKGNPKTIAHLLDITERKQAEEALRQNVLQLQAIYNSLPVIVWSMDEKGINTLSEGKELASVGLRPGQVVGTSYFEFFKDYPQMFEKGHIALGGESCECELEMMGNIYHTFLTPVFDENNAVRGVNGLAVNITEKRRVEEELRHLRNYLSNIINSMPSALVGVDIEGRVTQWNKTVERMTGISADAARGRTLVDLLPQMALEVDMIRKSIRTRQVMRDLKRPRPLEDGICYEDVTIYPLVTNGVEGAVIRIDDVTERVRLEEMMVQSEKMLSVGGLAAGMAHEINNPLAGMMQTADVMAGRLGRNLQIPANRKAAEAAGTTLTAVENFMKARGIPRMLSTISESGKRVAAIVDNMLSFARKVDATVSSHALDELLDKTLELASTDYDLKKQYDFKRIQIHREYADEFPAVPCEGTKIQQVLLNIFRNGAQAMQEAGTESPRFTVRTGFDRGRQMVRMEIEDNGPGMDEATRKRVYEPFFTTKPAGVGTGLGLSVSYFIITENHGGEMAVESAPGAGSKFIIRLPIDRTV
ncbi:MAG: PAS domain S-box protein [Deltaproteobacteria bacterium]|nr:PAS domain S-box protein [Deltaproteobacteria bacterium]